MGGLLWPSKNCCSQVLRVQSTVNKMPLQELSLSKYDFSSIAYVLLAFF